jgi:CubicO group peptidase (beta-lactamase class C family)
LRIPFLRCGRCGDCRLLLVMLCLAAATAAMGQRVVYPGSEWEMAAHGLPPTVQRRVDEYVHALDTTGLMVVQHGRVVYRYGDLQVLSYSASTRKSILVMLYGPYVQNGTIRLNRTLKDLGMSDLGGLLPIEERAKVVDLISARSGVYHPASYLGDNLDAAPKRGSQEPGSYWLYSNWDFNAAGAAFEKMTGKDIYDALRDDLAIPIGMQDFQRERQHKGGDLTRSQYPAYPMWLSTRDMARLAYLMLHQGRWRDRQLIPKEWVQKITSVVTPRAQLNPASYREGPFGYGYMWWVWEAPGPTPSRFTYIKGAYTAWGVYGQFITVLPQQDMVVAHKTVPVNREVTTEDYLHLLDRILGKTPASELILPVLWKQGDEEAFALATRLKTRSPGLLLDESDLYAAGGGLFRAGQPGRSEQVLKLNARLYPDSMRTLIALSRAQAAAGETAAALETARKVLALQPQSAPAKVQLASLGEAIEGHTALKLPLEKVRTLTGIYRSRDTRYVVALLNDHLRIQIYQDEERGDLSDEFEALAEADGRFFAPANGTLIRFAPDADGNAEVMEGTAGKETWRAIRR